MYCLFSFCIIIKYAIIFNVIVIKNLQKYHLNITHSPFAWWTITKYCHIVYSEYICIQFFNNSNFDFVFLLFIFVFFCFLPPHWCDWPFCFPRATFNCNCTQRLFRTNFMPQNTSIFFGNSWQEHDIYSLTFTG